MFHQYLYSYACIVWLFRQYLFSCFLLWIWAPRGESVLVCSFLMECRKGLACDVLYTLATPAGLVCDVTDRLLGTNWWYSWLYCILPLSNIWFCRAGWEIKWTLPCACFYFIPVIGTCGASLAWFPFKWALSDFYGSTLLSSSCPYCIWKPTVFEGHRHTGNVKLQLYITVTSNPSSINFP